MNSPTPTLGAEKWRALISAYPAGKKTIPTFCKERGVPASAFYYWRRRLGLFQTQEKAGTSLALSFVELDATVGTEPYEVVLRNHRRVVVPVSFDAVVLRRLLAAAEGET